MVYIHGGAFKGGDSTRRAWSPDYLMWEEVVYISIGYRLGPFGEQLIYQGKERGKEREITASLSLPQAFSALLIPH